MKASKTTPVNAQELIAQTQLSATLRELAARGELRQYRKGTLLIQEGDQGDTIYVILAGQLRAYAVAENGRELTHGVYGVGEYVGEMSLDGGPRSASVETMGACVCSVVTRSTLIRFIGEQPEFALELMSKLIRRARAATVSSKQLAFNDVYGRLKAFLDTLAAPDENGIRRIDQRLTHQTIAAHVGCSREMVSRIFKDLERGGHLHRISANAWSLSTNLPQRW